MAALLTYLVSFPTKSASGYYQINFNKHSYSEILINNSTKYKFGWPRNVRRF